MLIWIQDGKSTVFKNRRRRMGLSCADTEDRSQAEVEQL